jgi:L-lactate dehydrogenase complex protein LldG
MPDAKSLILDRIRAAVANTPPIEIPAVTVRSPSDVDLDLLEERLLDYGVRVYRCSRPELASTIAEAIAHAGRESLLIPPGLPAEILPADLVFKRDDGLSYGELDQAEGVLTGCAVAVAETGTIFLRHTEAEGRRVLTLLPDYHLCIIYREQVVGTVAEGIRQAAAFSNLPITTISGPSATSDIEMTRVKGVHGPRTLDVVLVI